LQPPQGDRGGGVAGQDHQVAALVEQGLAAGAGEVHDVLAAPHAVGHVGLVAEKHEIGAREPIHQGVVDGKAADAGIE